MKYNGIKKFVIVCLLLSMFATVLIFGQWPDALFVSSMFFLAVVIGMLAARNAVRVSTRAVSIK